MAGQQAVELLRCNLFAPVSAQPRGGKIEQQRVGHLYRRQDHRVAEADLNLQRNTRLPNIAINLIRVSAYSSSSGMTSPRTLSESTSKPAPL